MRFRNLIFSLVFLFISCSPLKKIGIDVLVPSEFSFKTDVNKIIALNNSVYPTLDSLSSGFPKPLSDNELFIIDTIVIRQLFDGLFSILNESPSPSLRNTDYLEFRNTEQVTIPEPLSETAVIDFCNETQSDAVISFEYYDFIIEYYYDYANLPEVHAYIKFNRKCLWRIYENNGNILDEYFLNDTVYWSSAGYSRTEADEGLPGMSDAIRSAFFYAGEKYGKRISPSWTQASRVFYVIKGRGVPIGRTDYSFSKEHLIKLSDNPKPETAYRACINLALISEKEDDLREALKWLEKAELKRPSTKLVREYIKIIRERLIMKEKIDSQLQFIY